MWSDTESVDAWPALADMMTGTTLIAFVLGIGAITMLPDGNENWDTLRVASERYAVTSKMLAEKDHIALPATLNGFVEGRLTDDVKRSVQLDEVKRELAEYEKMGAVRADVARRIQEALKKQGIAATAENGRIQVRADVLFASGESQIKGDVSTKLGIALFDVLKDPEIAQSVRYILVQGHTDAQGTGETNRKLSTDRARVIVEEWASAHPEFFRDQNDSRLGATGDACVGAKILFGGFGESRPVAGCDSVNCQQNRRLEIEIVPKRANERDIETCP